MKTFISSLLALTLLGVPQIFAGQKSAPEQSPKLFKDGDRVCFIGDSITHGAFYIENLLLFYTTRYPDARMQIYNAGMSGEGVGGVLKRLEWDVFNNKPDVSVIMIGMNDVPRGAYAEKWRNHKSFPGRVKGFHERYSRDMDKVVKALAERTKKVVVFTPSIFDQTVQSKRENLLGCNDALGWAAEVDKAVAKKYGAEVVDIWSYMTEMNGRYQQSDPTRSFIDFDRVHPRDLGGFVMMAKVAIDMDESPIVSQIQIDAGNKSSAGTINAKVSDVKADANGLSFTALEKALPFPMTAEKIEADKVLNFTDTFNRQILKVSGLKTGDYDLKIDGKKVGSYSSAQLEKGVNLASNKDTPQYRQAEEVAKLCRKFKGQTQTCRAIVGAEIWLNISHLKTVEERCRSLEQQLKEGKIKPGGDTAWAKAYPINKPREAELLEGVQQTIRQAYDAAKPVEHKFELVPAA